jgi:tRNA (uracil-5-)-methyltransferase TRM9
MDLEKKHVHEFYETHAADFSATRRKHWPKTEEFLNRYNSEGYVVLDSGCGNGRSFIRPNVVGLDYSHGLLLEARKRRSMGLVRGDVGSLPFPDSTFDIVLSIAVVHHLDSHGRRTGAMEEMKRVLKPGGKVLLCVWSKDACAKKKLSRIGSEGDYLATWRCDDRAKRYYHLFRSDELLKLCGDTGFEVIEHGMEDQSIFVVLEKRRLVSE